MLTTFKICIKCQRTWNSRVDFLTDSDLHVVAFEANTQSPDEGQIVFSHKADRCGAQILIPVAQFYRLTKARHYSKRLTGTSVCPGYCLDKRELRRCKAHCKCAFARETVAVVLCNFDPDQLVDFGGDVAA